MASMVSAHSPAVRGQIPSPDAAFPGRNPLLLRTRDRREAGVRAAAQRPAAEPAHDAGLPRHRLWNGRTTMRADVSFDSAGIQIAGHLYSPDDDTLDDSHIGPRPAIVVGHPGSGVKE